MYTEFRVQFQNVFQQMLYNMCYNILVKKGLIVQRFCFITRFMFNMLYEK